MNKGVNPFSKVQIKPWDCAKCSSHQKDLGLDMAISAIWLSRAL